MLYRFSVSPSHSLVAAVSEAKVAEKLKEAETEIVVKEIKTSSTAPTSPAPIASAGPITISADSIQKIPPFKPRKSKEWVPPHEVS